METFSLQPGKKITLHIPEGFYYAQAMVSIKAVGLTTEDKIHMLSFKITYKEARNSVSFHLYLDPPYFFGAGTFNDSEFAHDQHAGPFFFVDIESSINNPPIVIQVGFTDKLA